MNRLKALGASYEAGDLVKIVLRSYHSAEPTVKHGMIVDYFPSNLYESASYNILSCGEVLQYIEAKNVFKI